MLLQILNGTSKGLAAHPPRGQEANERAGAIAGADPPYSDIMTWVQAQSSTVLPESLP